MTITKTQILNKINSWLGANYNLTSGAPDYIGDEILAVLNDLTNDNNFLRLSASCSSVVGQHAYGETEFSITNLKSVISVKIDDEEPLERISWQRYQELIVDETSDNYNEPEYFYYDELNKKIYVYPAPDVATYTIYLEYYAIDNDLDNIQLGEEFRYLLYNGVAFEVLRASGKEKTEAAQNYFAFYDDKKKQMKIAKSSARYGFTKYRDV
jgi:hypothetical protein